MMGSLVFFLAIFPLSVLATFVVLRLLGFLKPTNTPQDDTERLRSRADRLVSESQEGAERSKRLERMLPGRDPSANAEEWLGTWQERPRKREDG